MQRDASFPFGAFALALIAGVVMLVSGVAWTLVAVVLLVWAGSLWLVGSVPPPAVVEPDNSALTEDRMGDLVENSNTPILVTRRNRIAIANRAARKLFGKHVIEQDIRIALRHPEAIALVESGGSGSASVKGLNARRDIWRINRKALDGEMAVIEFVNRTAEADISRAHTDFVANASHELRTPLAAIIGYVETLQDDDGDLDTPVAKKFLGTIQRESKRMQDLVSDLMSLSRIEAEKHELPKEKVDISALVERAARDVSTDNRADRLKLDVESGITVRGEEQQLEQLVRNLVDNAFKYGDADGDVRVALATSDKGRTSLEVVNRGEGIAQEHLPHLTRRFYRTDPGRSRASGGTGLGLAIVKHIVERHRGTLSIESKQGGDTTVAVALPIAS